MTSMIDIRMLAGQEGTKAVVHQWLKKAGDRVIDQEPLIELETDKVTFELAAPATGTLAEILINVGMEVPPDAILGRLSLEPFAVEPNSSSHGAAVGIDVEQQGASDKTELSPAVSQLLSEYRIDHRSINGTGRNGRITLEDATAEITRRPRLQDPLHPQGLTDGPENAEIMRIPHDTMRRSIAENMSNAMATVPHVTAIFEADFGSILAHRRAKKVEFARQGADPTVTAYLVLASVRAMRAAPIVNGRWFEDRTEVYSDINIGIGTALGDKGLIVPVIHGAQTMSLLEIALRLQNLIERARGGQLRPSDVKGGTFTISNHGVSGSHVAAPIIIHQSQSAILGVGRIEKRVVVREQDGIDTIAIRPMAYVSLSIDHRVLDAFQANAWLTSFVAELEGWK
jgi:2-oxoglutarate dehydrogenase E2 component (dihydrolipoamide succinyltransferase)